MNRFALAACCAVSLTSLAGLALPLPADSSSAVRAAFGNTIVSSYPDGRHAELWLNADGTYTARGRRHEPSNGRWKVKGSRLCLRQAHPATLPISYCTPIPADPSVKQWSGKAFSGETILITVTPGRPEAPV